MTFTKRQRMELSGISGQELADKIRNTALNANRAEYRCYLDEFSRRLCVPIDAVAIIRTDHVTTSHKTAYLWSTGSKVEQMRSYPGRKWNPSCSANTFEIEGENDARFINFLVETFPKSVVIGRGGYEVTDGVSVGEPQDEPVYQLMDDPITLSLGHVMDDFSNIRPNDKPTYIAIHSSFDDEHRTLFSSGLRTDNYDDLDEIELKTRHRFLLFRVSVADGKPRYILFDVKDDEGLWVSFADSKKTDRVISQLKNTQRQLAHPLVEEDSGYLQIPHSIRKGKIEYTAD